MTQQVSKIGIKPSEQYEMFKTRYINSEFSELGKFSKEWEKTLGREVNFVGSPFNTVKRDSTEYLLRKNK